MNSWYFLWKWFCLLLYIRFIIIMNLLSNREDEKWHSLYEFGFTAYCQIYILFTIQWNGRCKEWTFRSKVYLNRGETLSFEFQKSYFLLECVVLLVISQILREISMLLEELTQPWLCFNIVDKVSLSNIIYIIYRCLWYYYLRRNQNHYCEG